MTILMEVLVMTPIGLGGVTARIRLICTTITGIPTSVMSCNSRQEFPPPTSRLPTKAAGMVTHRILF
ncbi:hypothetical protein D3C85_1719430 [compost metagenome]